MDLKRAWKVTGSIIAVAGVVSFLPLRGEPIAHRARSLVVLVSIGAIFFLQARGDQLSKWLALLGIPLGAFLLTTQRRPHLSPFLGLSFAALGVLIIAAGRLLGSRSAGVRSVYALGGAIAISGVLMTIWYARG